MSNINFNDDEFLERLAMEDDDDWDESNEWDEDDETEEDIDDEDDDDMELPEFDDGFE